MSKAKLGMRTRRPIGNDDDSAVSDYDSGIAVDNVTVVDAGDLDAELDSTDAGVNGYSTGGSRYAHISTDGTNAVTVYAFNYSFGIWRPLMQLGPAGFVTTQLVAEGHYVLDISGVDRIAVTGGPASVKIAFNSFQNIKKQFTGHFFSLDYLFIETGWWVFDISPTIYCC